MARTIQQIKQTIIDAKNAEPNLSGLTSTSQTAVYNLWMYITAVAIYFFEGLLDLFKVEVESIIANQPVGTNKWVQAKVFDFQYDATTPQVVTLVDFVPGYNPVDETKQIITRCSVRTLPNKVVSVKTAKAEPPTPLSNNELSSLQGYLSDISFAGVEYQVQSLSPDYMYLQAEIKYNGQYASTITADTITAIETYLANIPFDGVVRVSEVEDAIQEVPGVKDLIVNNLALRANSVPFVSKVDLVANNQELIYKYGLVAGYAVEETAPNDLASSLTFTVES